MAVMRGLWSWFLTRSAATKAGLILASVVLAVLLSPLLAPFVALVFFVSLGAILLGLLRRRSVRLWGIVALASLLGMAVLGGASQVVYGNGAEQEQRATVPERPEAAAAAQPEPTMEDTLPKTTAAPPAPRTFKDKIVANLAEQNRGDDEVLVERVDDGCRNVTFNYTTPFVGSTIPSEPSVYYEAVYGDRELRDKTCRVETNAYGELVDKYGNTTREVVFTASLNKKKADKINWNDTLSVDFESLQKVEFIHPSVEANVAEENAQNAVDCMQDEGMFDFDFGC